MNSAVHQDTHSKLVGYILWIFGRSLSPAHT